MGLSATLQDMASDSSAPTISNFPANDAWEGSRNKRFVRACWMSTNSRGSILSQMIPGLLEGGYG